MVTGTPDELKQSISGDVVTISSCATKEEECQEFLHRSESALSGEPFVIRTQAMDGELAVYVDHGESAMPIIMRLLSSQGIEVKTISMARPSLDDVFLKYTGRTMRAEEGSATTYVEAQRKRSRRHQ